MYILIGIVFIIVGLLMILSPSTFYTLSQSWKIRDESKPSTLFVISTRVGGICFSFVGVLAVMTQFFL